MGYGQDHDIDSLLVTQSQREETVVRPSSDRDAVWQYGVCSLAQSP